MKRMIVAVVVSAIVAMMAVAPAAAQYPPPTGSVAVAVSDQTPGVGETVTVDVVVSATQAAVPGGGGHDILASVAKPAALTQAPPYACTSSVAGGSGATVTPTSFNTDAQGKATLSVFTGTQPGQLTVSVKCGELSSQVILTVGGGGATGTPPSSGGGQTPVPGAPNTGLGGGSTGSSSPIAWIVIGVGAGMLALASVTYLAARRRLS
jgi:hypothetical protein